MSSIATGVQGGQVVGSYTFSCCDGISQGVVVWDATTHARIDLAGGGFAEGTGVFGGRQVGWIQAGVSVVARMWNSAPGAGILLNPKGAGNSAALAIHENRQVGWASLNPAFSHPVIPHAALWSGTAESFVNLHPAQASTSEASAVHGERQGGSAVVNGVQRASIWSGTAQSWKDLTPATATSGGVNALYQEDSGGAVMLATGEHAALWLGTTGTWVDLNPAGASASVVNGMYGEFQVGYAIIGGVQRAGIWQGSAASWLDLSSVLAQAGDSAATGVWSDGQTIYVSGWGPNPGTAHGAILWTRPVPTPGVGALFAMGAVRAASRRRHVV